MTGFKKALKVFGILVAVYLAYFAYDYWTGRVRYHPHERHFQIVTARLFAVSNGVWADKATDVVVRIDVDAGTMCVVSNPQDVLFHEVSGYTRDSVPTCEQDDRDDRLLHTC